MKIEKNTEIKQTRKGKITFYKASKIVKKMGNGGHVTIPKELIGKEITIIWEDENKHKGDKQMENKKIETNKHLIKCLAWIKENKQKLMKEYCGDYEKHPGKFDSFCMDKAEKEAK